MQPRSSTSSNKRPRSTGCLKRSGTKNTTPPAFFCVVVVVSGGVGVVVVTRSAYATIIVLSEISWGQKLASSLYADRCTYTLRRFDVTGFGTHTRARTHARSHARTYTHTHSLTRTRAHIYRSARETAATAGGDDSGEADGSLGAVGSAPNSPSRQNSNIARIEFDARTGATVESPR